MNRAHGWYLTTSGERSNRSDRSVCVSATLDAGGYPGSFDQGESVQVDERGLVEVGSDVAAGEGVSDRQAPLSAPVEDDALTVREHLGGDAFKAADLAPLVGIHSRVVEAQVEVADPIGLCDCLFDSGQILVGVVDVPECRVRMTGIVVE